MSMSGLIGEFFIQSEVEQRRERAMQQYNRRPPRSARGNKHHLTWPLARHTSGQTQHGRPVVS
jgi:hypothetical protein